MSLGTMTWYGHGLRLRDLGSRLLTDIGSLTQQSAPLFCLFCKSYGTYILTLYRDADQPSVKVLRLGVAVFLAMLASGPPRSCFLSDQSLEDPKSHCWSGRQSTTLPVPDQACN